jgi:hypothetical protein
LRDLLIPPRKGGIKRARGGGGCIAMGGGGEVTSDLLSWESKQQVTWNFSPFVLSIPKKTGGNLNCGPTINMEAHKTHVVACLALDFWRRVLGYMCPHLIDLNGLLYSCTAAQ